MCSRMRWRTILLCHIHQQSTVRTHPKSFLSFSRLLTIKSTYECVFLCCIIKCILHIYLTSSESREEKVCPKFRLVVYMCVVCCVCVCVSIKAGKMQPKRKYIMGHYLAGKRDLRCRKQEHHHNCQFRELVHIEWMWSTHSSPEFWIETRFKSILIVPC